MSFEGAEKLLEISFHPLQDHDHNFNPIPGEPMPATAFSAPVGTGSADPVEQHQLITPALSDNSDLDEDDDGAGLAKLQHPNATLSAALKIIAGDKALGTRPTKQGLRDIDRDTWQSMLDLVHCQILSVIENEHCDAYLLSESSLFVYPKRIILKTCGTTTLLLALPRILEIASKLKLKIIDKLFYSRKCFQFPEKQKWPHSSWDDEVEILDGMLVNGASYILGKTNAEHWYLYAAGRQFAPLGARIDCDSRKLIIPAEAHANLRALTAHGTDPPDLLACCAAAAAGGPSRHGPGGHLDDDSGISDCASSTAGECPECGPSKRLGLDDRCLEVIMTGLNESRMQEFFYADGRLGNGSKNYVDAVSGLDQIIPGMQWDSYLFEPCGWSSNGLLDGHYATFHVTPEPSCSYASFETNVPLATNGDDPFTYRAVISRLLDVFGPERITLTQFSNDLRSAGGAGKPTLPPMTPIEGYRLVDVTVNMLPHYHLFYCHYVREGAALRPRSVSPLRSA